MKEYFVYILSSITNVLYVGVTSNLLERVRQHKEKEEPDSFTAKYGVDRLVYFEVHNYPHHAIYREKRLKKWKRRWKLELIWEENPEMKDLSEEWNL